MGMWGFPCTLTFAILASSKIVLRTIRSLHRDLFHFADTYDVRSCDSFLRDFLPIPMTDVETVKTFRDANAFVPPGLRVYLSLKIFFRVIAAKN